ncbi:MAG: hypothetical protein EOO16_16265 [Chitinophagaceae bacterium]|nr:MAG: hypothetical protein EOO16_16265 [Chitinophagaceae bacterium]
MSINRSAQEIPQESIDFTRTSLVELMSRSHAYRQTVDAGERRGLAKMAAGRLPVAQSAHRHMQSAPELVPGFIDVRDVTIDLGNTGRVSLVHGRVEQFGNELSDILLVSGAAFPARLLPEEERGSDYQPVRSLLSLALRGLFRGAHDIPTRGRNIGRKGRNIQMLKRKIGMPGRNFRSEVGIWRVGVGMFRPAVEVHRFFLPGCHSERNRCDPGFSSPAILNSCTFWRTKTKLYGTISHYLRRSCRTRNVSSPVMTIFPRHAVFTARLSNHLYR